MNGVCSAILPQEKEKKLRESGNAGFVKWHNMNLKGENMQILYLQLN